jgi:hypothetical protein
MFSTIMKRKIFVSYHHGGDQAYYDYFSKAFGSIYEVMYDNSLDRQIDSDDAEYVMQKIREDYIVGSSCTVVLCGLGTPWRKFVDWEIKSTLDKQHGLIGIKLPTLQVVNNGCRKPDRLQDNIDSDYAVWSWWENTISSSTDMAALIEAANSRSKLLIRNDRPRRLQNG